MTNARDVERQIMAEKGYINGAMQLHKLLYYCQAWHLVWTGDPLFPEDIEAWDMGPVVADLWRENKHGAVMKADRQDLSPKDLKTVRYVIERYGSMPGYELSALTHSESPWRHTTRSTVISHSKMVEEYSKDPAAEQAWFWDDEWQEGEAAASLEIEKGEVSEPLDADEFFASL